MLLFAGYDFCKCSQKSVLKINIVLLLFISCYVHPSYSDCTFTTKTEESQDIFKRLRPLQGKTLTSYDVEGKAPLPFEVGICSSPNATVAAVVYNKNISFGNFNQSSISSGMNYIQLSYEGPTCSNCSNSTRRSRIMFVCDLHTDFGTLKMLENFEVDKLRCSYTFEIGTRFACIVKEGLSSGSIFCILFFTGVGLYLLLGFLYQRLLVGAKGLEQIPNYSFWKDFGNLQADGCDFFCRCGPRQEAQSYRGIDDRLPRDDERDDQLLNM